MTLAWKELTGLTGDRGYTVERIRLSASGISIDGSFELPPLAQLTAEDQAFVSAFVHCHGSIKQMEKWFGVSYPTIKNRLNRIAQRLDFVELETAAPETTRDVLDRLERGEIDVDQAVDELTP